MNKGASSSHSLDAIPHDVLRELGCIIAANSLLPAIGLVSFVFSNSATAETVEVKYRGAVPLDTFQCIDTFWRSFVQRVCYDADQQYLIVMLDRTYYHYCGIDDQTVASLINASSVGQYFNQNIRGTGRDGPFDCRTHRVPTYE